MSNLCYGHLWDNDIQIPFITEHTQNYNQNQNTHFNLYFIGKEQVISYNENTKNIHNNITINANSTIKPDEVKY
jgi:hypothetical protein